MPLVSIIVPIYNAEKYLSECFDSLINQTYKNIEIICINDGSKDKSLEVLKEYAKKDDRIKIFSQENSGEAVSRNRGLELSNGKYITALDADDYCSIDTIETSVNIAETTNCDIVINFVNASFYMLHKKPEDYAYTTMWQMFLRKDFVDKNSDIKFTKDIVLGPDAVYTHKILCQTDKIEINKTSKHYYRRYPEQVTSRIEGQADKLIYYMKMILVDLEHFYNSRNLWKGQNDHFMNFLLEISFYHYLHGNFNNKQKQEIFELIHKIVEEHNLKENFTRKDIRIFMFKKFLKSRKYQDFELYLSVMKIIIKLRQIIRNIKNRGNI